MENNVCIYSPKHVFMLLQKISLRKHYDVMMRVGVRWTVKQKTIKRRQKHKKKKNVLV